ncbi:MAG: hypothetical protein ACKOYI_10580, partial [Actinomycetota bacterium]
MSKSSRRAIWAGSLASLLFIAACVGGGDSTETASQDTVAPTTTVAPEPTTTTTTIQPILAPLTGLPVDAPITRPALVVKIDNHPKA